MREELRLISGHVHVNRAFRLATLAGQTKAEGFAHIRVAPLSLNHFAMEHLKEQPRATAGGMLFLSRGSVAGAHRAAAFLAAFANADTTLDGLLKTSAILREGELRLRLPRLVIQAHAQIFIHAIRIHELAGIHSAFRVPNRLEFAERLRQLRPEHFRIKLGARLPVAVLAGKRPSVAQRQVSGFLHESTKAANAFRASEVEIDAHMNAALAEMAVGVAPEVMRLHQAAEIAQIIS